jgi:DNA-binding transcriptional LysR family regulator
MAFDGRLLSGIGVLAAVVEAGSFVGAGDALGLSASGVSRAVARLEARVGVRLVQRTTRSLALTDEGRRFYDQVRPLLLGIEDAAGEAAAAAGAVRGRLRVSADAYFTRVFLAARLAEFLERYPEVSLDLMTRDVMGDLVAEGFDVAVRFGEPTEAGLIGRKLAETHIRTVAAPAYLARKGRPPHPSALADHEAIHFRDPRSGQPFDWEFHRGGQVLPVRVEGRLLVSDAGALVEACLAGAGVAQMLAVGAVGPLIQSGALIDLFPDWAEERYPLYALYPARRHPPAKVRAFVDFCQAALKPS